MSLYAEFVRQASFPLSLWRRGESATLRYRNEFEVTQYLCKEELHDLQWSRMRMLLRHAYEQCPYYQKLFDQVGVHPSDLRCLADVRALPILEKSAIQRHGEEMIARNWPREDLIRNQTGGSTGTPITFYLCRDRKCSRAAATLRHNRWAGWEVGDAAAVVWGAPRDKPGSSWRARLYASLLREPFWLDTACLTEETMERFHLELSRRPPKIIQAYAQACVAFARWLEARGKRPIRPQAIITSAEVLDDPDRALIERVFGCAVFNRYGCREVSVIASECDAHQGMHVMAEGLYVEIETAEGPARPGEAGSVLVTDLMNPAMPLIRYRIGDVASWAEGDCPCGRNLPRLEKVAGRVTEFLVGAEGRLVSGVYLATYVVAQRPSLGQVRILQDRVDQVVYQVFPGLGFDLEADRAYLEAATRELLGRGITATVEVVDELRCAPSGKFVFSRCTVVPEYLAPGGAAATPEQIGSG